MHVQREPRWSASGVVKELPWTAPDERGVAEAMANNGTMAGWLSTWPENPVAR